MTETLKPLLADLAEPEFIIETDLTDEERTIIAEGRKELKEHPENFEEAQSFFASLGLSYSDALETVKKGMTNQDYWKPVIEPAGPEEIEMVNERLKDYERDPSSFVPFKRRKEKA